MTAPRIPSIVIASLAALMLLAAAAAASPLTGSGTHLPIPSPNPGAPAAIARSITSINTGTGWTGGWSAPAFAPWQGTFSATGPVPTGNSNPTGHTSPTGLTFYDFSTMLTGTLPTGTYFRFGDVDAGSTTSEIYTLIAIGVGGPITTPWLDGPIGVTGTYSSSADLPSWNFNPTNGAYTFDGSTVNGNPNAAFWLASNTPISSMDVTRTSEFQNFALYAPVPTPAAAPAGAILLAAAGLRRRKRTRRT